MKIPRVFQLGALNKGRLSLDNKAVQHLSNSLRMKPGDLIEVFNGQGGAWTGKLEVVNKRSIEVELNEFSPLNFDSSLKLHLAQAVSKGTRMDFVMQKATELGVNSITPIITERCEVKLDAVRWQKKIASWQSQVYSACEQCGLNIPPIVQPVATLTQWIKMKQYFDKSYVLHPHVNASARFDAEAIASDAQVGLVIGPEGGFSDTEIEMLLSQFVTPVSLGSRILRTETAPIVAITLLQHFSGNLV